jgi:hypothetical protein
MRISSRGCLAASIRPGLPTEADRVRYEPAGPQNGFDIVVVGADGKNAHRITPGWNGGHTPRDQRQRQQLRILGALDPTGRQSPLRERMCWPLYTANVPMQPRPIGKVNRHREHLGLRAEESARFSWPLVHSLRAPARAAPSANQLVR